MPGENRVSPGSARRSRSGFDKALPYFRVAVNFWSTWQGSPLTIIRPLTLLPLTLPVRVLVILEADESGPLEHGLEKTPSALILELAEGRWAADGYLKATRVEPIP